MFLIFWESICLGIKKLVRWRKKCNVHLISLPHSHKRFKASWKQCLNLCSSRWLRPRPYLVKSLCPRGLWISKAYLAKDRIKIRNFFLELLRLAEFLILGQAYSYLIKQKKKRVFEIIMSYFYWKSVIFKSDIVPGIYI